MSRKQPLKVELPSLPQIFGRANSARDPKKEISTYKGSTQTGHAFGKSQKHSVAIALTSLFSLLAVPSAATDGTEIKESELGAPNTIEMGPLELRAIDYIRFREDVTTIEGLKFENAQTMRDAHKRLAAHDTQLLSAGWMAYAALIAADTPAFSDSIKAEVLGANGDKKKRKKRRRKKRGEPQELAGRDAFIAKISANPRYPRQMPGAQEAIVEIMKMTNKDHSRVTALGENFKSQAYAMQKTRWGKRKIAQSATQRISEAEYYSRSRPGMALPRLESIKIDGVNTPGIMATTDYTWKPDWGYMTSRTNANVAGSDPVIDRILNLAARYSVDALNNKVVQTYARNTKAEQCLSLVKLTLNQCIAATRTPYEEAFCLGEHGLNDVASCVGWVAGHG